ncbi:MAG: DUF4129 domain-containing protein [Deltaproteobacteria bacterium]|jgi:hypothetical protein|nr:DUF4129 domain-containing protein [Deltaproteobacteria bacterium]
MMFGKKTLLVPARAGMELSWRYAWAGFLMLLICHRVFPLAETFGAFVAAAVLNRLFEKHSWRLYQSLFLEGVGLAVFALLILYRSWYESVPFFSFTWLNVFFRGSTEQPHQSVLLLILFCLLLVWRGGRLLLKRPMDYHHVCIQFDKGIGLFMLLLLVKFLIQNKAGIFVDGLAMGFLVCAFFLFSLLSIFLVRKQPALEKSFMTGYHGIGIALSMTSLMILFGSAATFFFYPTLTQVADSLQVLLKDASGPLLPVLVAILVFFLAPGKMRDDIGELTGSLSDMSGFSPPTVGKWETLLLKGISLGLMVVMGILAAGLGSLFIRYLLRLLMKKHTPNSSQRSPAWFRDAIGWLMSLPVRVWRKLLSWLESAQNAAAVYSGLLVWGRHSGLPLLTGETPAEYGKRLVLHFPDLVEEIDGIIDAFNRETYGRITIDRDILFRLCSAQRRMKRLRYWPSRLKTCFSR